MKNRIIVYLIRSMEMLMQVMVFTLALLLLVMGFFGRSQTEPYRCFLAMGVPCVALYFTRLTARNNIIVIAVHGASLVFMLLFGRDGVEKLAYSIIGIVVIIFSVVLSINGRTRFGEKMPIGMIGVFILAAVVGKYAKLPVLEQWAMVCGIVFIAVQIIYCNLNNLNDFMLVNHEVMNFPAKQMVSVNAFIMTVLLVICAGGMVLSNSSYIFKMLKGIGSLLTAGIRFLVQAFVREDENVLETGDTREPEDQENILGGLEIPEDGPWTDILNGIALVVGVIVIVALVICIAIAFVRLLRSMQGAAGREGDIKEFIKPEGVRAVRLKGREVHKEDPKEPNNIRVRKLYKSTVKKNAAKKGASLRGNMTPAELSGAYIPMRQEEVTEIYEKARYSDLEIAKEELELMKAVKKAK